MQTTYQTPLELGTHVFTKDGEKLGDIVEIQTHYFVVEKGIIFTSDLHFPMSAITSRDEDGVRLSLSKDDVENGDWSDATIVNMESSGPVGYAGRHASQAPGQPTGQAADMASVTERQVSFETQAVDRPASRDDFLDDETARP